MRGKQAESQEIFTFNVKMHWGTSLILLKIVDVNVNMTEIGFGNRELIAFDRSAYNQQVS